MLRTLLKIPFNDSKYLYEVKWDGYRIIAYKEGRMARLESRGGLDYTNKYPPVANALLKLKDNVVLDGEVVALDAEVGRILMNCKSPAENNRAFITTCSIFSGMMART
jgi:bifunctional non-homologous end joining protein LigD